MRISDWSSDVCSSDLAVASSTTEAGQSIETSCDSSSLRGGGRAGRRRRAGRERGVSRILKSGAGSRRPQWSTRRPITASNLRSEEHTSELQSLMRISYAVFCLKKKTKSKEQANHKQKYEE